MKIILICIASLLINHSFSQAPDWEWVLTLNGPSVEVEIDAIASDNYRNVFISGKFEDTLTIAGDSNPLVSAGMADIMLIKYDSTGNHLWTRQYGGIGEDNVFDAVCDNSGSIILGGYFQDTLILDSEVLISEGGLDGFMAKIDGNGNVLWAISYGGVGDEGSNEISVDQYGNIFTCVDSDGDITIGSYNFINTGLKDSYLMALNNAGVVSWVRSIEGAGTIRGKSIAVDSIGNVLFGGDFSGPNAAIDELENANAFNSFGAHDAFLSSWTVNGDLNWTKSWGGNGSDLCKGLTTNNLGEIYACGTFENTSVFDNQSLSSAGQKDFFLWKLDSQGNTIWLRQISSTESISGAEIENDGRGGCLFGLGIKGTIILDESNSTTSITTPPISGSNGRYPVLINYNEFGDISFTKMADLSYFAVFDEISRSGNQIFLDAPYAGVLNLGNFSNTASSKDAALVSIKLPNLILNVPKIGGEEMKLYPTIADNYIILDFGDEHFESTKNIKILDVNGKTIQTLKINQQQLHISITEFQSGLYFVCTDKSISKFIKK